MYSDFLIRAPVGLLPVLFFLAVLVWMDSYKLVKLRTVVMVILAGGITAGASYLANLLLLEHAGLDLSLSSYSRYMAPAVEEILKASVILYLIKTHRVGFLVDAAIFGFAVGAGFAMIENIYYLNLLPDATIGVWIVRGFGTALMHGGCTAIFALVSMAMIERVGGMRPRAFLPGLAIAIVIHSVFNHFFLAPILNTLGIMLVLPPLMYAIFEESEKAVEDWLGVGFDADTELLELINSGQLSDSPVGEYLHDLKEKFQGPVVADLLCYLRLHTELALRAKGVLMMRENGFDVPVDEETQAKFIEMTYLEGSIGKTGRLALKPFLHMSHKDLWQLYMLGR